MAVALSAATTSAHHVTTIFGGVLFVIPLALDALRQITLDDPRRDRPAWQRPARYALPLVRGLFLGALMIAAVAVTVLPYWIWSIRDPISQVPIPHGSASFIDQLQPLLGLQLPQRRVELRGHRRALFRRVGQRAHHLGCAVDDDVTVFGRGRRRSEQHQHEHQQGGKLHGGSRR